MPHRTSATAGNVVHGDRGAKKPEGVERRRERHQQDAVGIVMDDVSPNDGRFDVVGSEANAGTGGTRYLVVLDHRILRVGRYMNPSRAARIVQGSASTVKRS